MLDCKILAAKEEDQFCTFQFGGYAFSHCFDRSFDYKVIYNRRVKVQGDYILILFNNYIVEQSLWSSFFAAKTLQSNIKQLFLIFFSSIKSPKLTRKTKYPGDCVNLQ